ncbi:MAG: DUF2147 domain-containing protein [Pseudomonadota bacterium]
MKTVSISAVLFAMVAGAHAAPIEGVYNTGVSEVEGADEATLDIEFHPCADDGAKTCGTILRVVNPSPDASDVMPDGSPVVGFEMINGLKDKGDGKFRGGRINAVDESLEKGKMMWYGLKIDQLGGGDLKVRGCLSVICGRTMVWSPRADEPSASSE